MNRVSVYMYIEKLIKSQNAVILIAAGRGLLICISKAGHKC